MKNAIQNETTRYALSFGEKSQFDECTLKIFKEFGAKSSGEQFNDEVPRSYFSMIQDYNEIVEDLDKPLIWRKTLDSNKNSKL